MKMLNLLCTLSFDAFSHDYLEDTHGGSQPLLWNPNITDNSGKMSKC